MSSRKKYQVFISSTYEDLKEERKAVEEAVIRSGDLPVGMEAFPAADEEIFDFIKTIITECDYYVLLVAGRYGQFSPDGRSYTEKEFDYAVERGIPVLALLHKERASLPANMTERSEAGQKALERFVQKISTGRLRKEWSTVDGLKLAVREALDHAKATKPRPGWIKGDVMTNLEVMEELNELRKKNDELVARIGSFAPPAITSFDPAGMDARIVLSGSHRWKSRDSSHSGKWTVQTTVGKVFSVLSPYLLDSRNQEGVAGTLGNLFVKHNGYGTLIEGTGKADEESLLTLRIQLEAIGLLSVYRSNTVSGGVGTFWALTELGQKEMYERRVVPKV